MENKEVNMYKSVVNFKVGDLVRVSKPEDPLGYKDTQGWVDEMDIVIGREVRISGIPGEKWVEIMINGDVWTFHSDWCDLVTEESKVATNTAKFKVGDKVRVTKPNKWEGKPSWPNDALDGGEFVVEGVTVLGYIMVVGCNWYLSSSWCTLVSSALEEPREDPREELIAGIGVDGPWLNASEPECKAEDPTEETDAVQLRKRASQWEATTSGVDDPNVAASGIPYFFYDPDWCTSVDSRPKLSSESISKCPVQPKIRVYIAGKISGLCQSDVNRTFGEAAEKLRKWGFEPISPIEHGGENKTWAEYMLTLLPILHDCQGIYLLDNWDDSDGAKVEKLFAKKDGMFLIREVR